jgi:hypothetical protein
MIADAAITSLKTPRVAAETSLVAPDTFKKVVGVLLAAIVMLALAP